MKQLDCITDYGAAQKLFFRRVAEREPTRPFGLELGAEGRREDGGRVSGAAGGTAVARSESVKSILAMAMHRGESAENDCGLALGGNVARAT